MKTAASTLRSSSIRRTACRIGFTVWVALLVAACQGGFVPSLTPTQAASATFPASPFPAPSQTLPSAIKTPDPSPSALIPSATPAVQVCSPLKGFTLDQVAGLVSNPYHPPPLGSDDPHAGVDLADVQAGSSVAVAGRTVQIVLPGQAAAVVADRFPFGNALIVETPLTILPPDWVARLQLPQPYTGPAPHTNLTCPTLEQPAWNFQQQSIYLLYAHLQAQPKVKLNDALTCGQEIGTVGSSGNALNPHLHLEARVGPAGARFQSLSHYSNSATQAEMDAYCTWSVRGTFQTFDPLSIFLP